ncbi:hypothetical protein DY000_02050679 [Brassica cretica]|uniref:Uncharacterized protein n=1 Tax=Brassica cretica TaxID=69181 RepID=A0ABQ7F4V7_BRACR|nr:hypothetical protein DY000_02050679 [Brassica cretica]
MRKRPPEHLYLSLTHEGGETREGVDKTHFHLRPPSKPSNVITVHATPSSPPTIILKTCFNKNYTLWTLMSLCSEVQALHGAAFNGEYCFALTKIGSFSGMLRGKSIPEGSNPICG